MAKVISTTVENGIRVTKFDDGTTIKSKNEQPLSQYIATQHCDVDIIKSPQTGKMFFACGKVRGYISPAALKAIEAGCASSDINYSEVAINSDDYVPTLMVKATANVVRTFKA